ncbi:UPF0481 protein At3g47200-like [Macadamia integrifolia]|uniref:UPF0481 protein At3g47200-like n=1 Tax=Macadamia integrifolia TaxID=60698 RepID=UPI001C4F83DB|nr:UPF0481 protein At3g47200-like [Macadamia integrifolia]
MRMGKKLREPNPEDELGKHSHIIRISDCDINQNRLASMKRRTLESPRLLNNSSGRSSCSIFRVPQRFIEMNGRVYEPNVVSIGPYHRGKPHLRMIEEHKWRFLGSLLSRTQSKGLTLEDYVRDAKRLEPKARECYSETISLDSDEFAEMVVLDSCFIIEICRIVGKLVPADPDDPILSTFWLFTFLLRDFLRFENQLPFFVLQSLFDLSKMPEEEEEYKTGGGHSPSLAMLALLFFNHATLDRPHEVIERFRNYQPKHLLDLLRSTYTELAQEEPRKGKPTTHVIETVTKLRLAGISFKERKSSDNFLDVNFRNGVLEMPAITIDDFTSSFFANCVAFEQCHKHCSNQITSYATLLDCLINTYKDVEFLCDAKIIENYFGTEGEVARFFNNLGKETAFDVEKSYLSNLFGEVNDYYRNGWHVQWASFKYTYFDTPWSFISAVAAVILLVLTVIQTFYSAYPYVFEPKKQGN